MNSDVKWCVMAVPQLCELGPVWAVGIALKPEGKTGKCSQESG